MPTLSSLAAPNRQWRQSWHHDNSQFQVILFTPMGLVQDIGIYYAFGENLASWQLLVFSDRYTVKPVCNDHL